MGRISTGVGLVSGINSKDIIDQLMALESRPKLLLQSRINSTEQQKAAFSDILSRLNSLKSISTTLKKPSTFQAAATTSSNSDVLTATAKNGAAVGTYQFQVARLVTSQQAITAGFRDDKSVPVGAGTLTIEMGGGEVSSQTVLAQLNGGAGIRRGAFRITDRTGATAVIDTTTAVTLDDVLRKINTSLDVNVRATLDKDRIVLTDLNGASSGVLRVQDLAGGSTAADLGIAGESDAGTPDVLQGTDINYLSRNTLLSQLSDGRGVRTASSGADFRVSVGGTDYDITLGAAKTVGEVMDVLNNAAPGVFSAELVAGGNGLRLTTAGGAAVAVTALNSQAAADLGIQKSSVTGQIDGSALLASVNSVLVSSLNGGKGLPLGSITLTDRAGQTDTVDLSQATTVQDILDAINNGPNTSLRASLNASGNGIQIADETGGTGDLIIDDVDPLVATAAALGIQGTFDTSKPVVSGANLQRQWVTENTLLKDYNGGKGITLGKIRITDSQGVSKDIDLSAGASKVALQDIISAINTSGAGVVASINDNGDGLLLTDTAGGSGTMKVEDLNGTTAADLRIAGSATGTTINGSFEQTITIDADDTLADVQGKINTLGFGVSAGIVNDGSLSTPYRLQLTARNSGYRGRVVFDAGTTGLAASNLVEAQDAAVFLGSASAAQPLLVTSSTNQLANVIQGVTIDLHGVSSQPVTLNVTRNSDDIVKQVQDFVDGFNQIVEKITTLTKWDADTKTRGLLLGDSTLQQVQTAMYNALQTAIPEAGRYRIFADVGLSVGDGAKLSFDAEKFRTAMATDPAAVSRLFTLSSTDADGKLLEKGLGAKIETALTRLTEPITGIIPRQNTALDDRTRQFQDRIKQLDATIAAKRARLEKQFANLESVLAGLQSQQQAISNMATIAYSSSSKK